MESFNHISPIDNSENPYSHKMELLVDGEKVGEADVEYFSRPFPLYQISLMSVEFEKQGQGFGSKLMGYIESFLKQTGKAGVLIETIDPNSSAARMYARRGWIEIPNSFGLHVFNIPEGATIDQLKGYSFRYTDPSIREGNTKHGE